MAEMQISVKPKGIHKIVKKIAEEYALEGTEDDTRTNIIFDPKEQDLDSWLEDNLPSKLDSRSDSIRCRLVVYGQNNVEIEKGDVVGLLTEWNHLKESGASIDRQLILELGKRYKVVAGKWLFHVQKGHKVDILWGNVSRSLQHGALSHVAHSAKVTSHIDNPFDQVAICVFNEDYTDYDSVCALEQALRQTGIKCKLMYKPDVYNYLGINRKNELGVRPTIYTSQFDVLKRVSTIEVTNDLKYNY